ncbi:hypothetical protein HK097_002866 [Rhizophlyctis rosea]|uniref:Uncharacterized protein n=1 Tax=Rhizophlyctis rosea TaxID=64517 RepID=A0AAD5X0Y3_9FUNG|nr:hypothetical protein HK097_002866 [Rhizophlyctis rosea]
MSTITRFKHLTRIIPPSLRNPYPQTRFLCQTLPAKLFLSPEAPHSFPQPSQPDPIHQKPETPLQKAQLAIDEHLFSKNYIDRSAPDQYPSTATLFLMKRDKQLQSLIAEYERLLAEQDATSAVAPNAELVRKWQSEEQDGAEGEVEQVERTRVVGEGQGRRVVLMNAVVPPEKEGAQISARDVKARLRTESKFQMVMKRIFG